jgi:hypothetical protein
MPAVPSAGSLPNTPVVEPSWYPNEYSVKLI